MMPTFHPGYLTVAALEVSAETARRKGNRIALHQNADLAFHLERYLDGKPARDIGATNV